MVFKLIAEDVTAYGAELEGEWPPVIPRAYVGA